MRFSLRVLIGLITLFGSNAAVSDVIANASVPGRSISASAIRNIYTLRQTSWPDRRPIVVFVLPDDHPAHLAFAKETLGIYPYRLRQTWDRLSYSGMSSPPIEVKDETEMRMRVRATPGAIGYLSKDTSHDGIKTLTLE
jgi:ABC-type phosphate transport system substrate-binding protein